MVGHKTKNLQSTSQKDKEKGNIYTKKSFLIRQGPGELSAWHQEASESLAVHSEEDPLPGVVIMTCQKWDNQLEKKQCVTLIKQKWNRDIGFQQENGASERMCGSSRRFLVHMTIRFQVTKWNILELNKLKYSCICCNKDYNLNKCK